MYCGAKFPLQKFGDGTTFRWSNVDAVKNINPFTIDKSKVKYKHKLESVHSRPSPTLFFQVVRRTTTTIKRPSLKENWTAAKKRTSIPSNSKQKDFLTKQFDDGIRSDMKYDPTRVDEEIHTRTSNGQYLFDKNECLTPQQIRSYFSRLAKNRKNTS
ncbi:unnamed protein product [Didymodactylos carnosus]|uniref:Uncharacterized protein n=1 Tax=Didymodactylos carnosus TaxID=1234261 RepID=A0A816A802_9BILA|nr:unnamed protein product [Didymodactylos carnosus]CAF1592412.1 unnamed protein product [Didymodactylos carnosus]CAF3730190.1 unnamed protein product [Didymodactylos carnosus]CAF4465200.1 unnamed protein product [Didymodactylos carnosus]